jgi:hypothetical protein
VIFLVSPSFGSFAKFRRFRQVSKFRQVSEDSEQPKLKPKKGKTFCQSQNGFAQNIMASRSGQKSAAKHSAYAPLFAAGTRWVIQRVIPVFC